MWQPGSPKDSSSTSHKYIYWILHMAFNCHRRKWQLLGDWMRQDWLGLCSSPLKPHRLNHFLFLHFALGVEKSRSCWEEKPRCNHWLTIFNQSWTRSIWPVTPTTMPLAAGTGTARGHGVWTHWEPITKKLILKNYSVAGHLLTLKANSTAALSTPRWTFEHLGIQETEHTYRSHGNAGNQRTASVKLTRSTNISQFIPMLSEPGSQMGKSTKIKEAVLPNKYHIWATACDVLLIHKIRSWSPDTTCRCLF